jgi:antitoxin (DNA-binding transcriptional repressor) of toxin-antitoxin stability system
MKTVGIADLKARLSEHLRTVRRGGSLMVVDRDRPVAVPGACRERGNPGALVGSPRSRSTAPA